MRQKQTRFLDDDQPFEDLTADWLPELRAALRESCTEDDLGLRALAEFPEALATRRRPTPLLLAPASLRCPRWPDAA